jgi:rSAM/selenodomain-associated transferase 1
MKSSQKQEQLIIFTRYPEPGKTKTRLAPSLGDRGAADIQKELTENTLSRVRQLQKIHPVDISIYFAGGDLERMQEWLGSDLVYRQQKNGDLGERLTSACGDAFAQVYRRVVVIGSDCPGIMPRHITRAFEALLHRDLVLGPATDGGYYLIGLNREIRPLFNRIPWGTDAVLTETINAGKQLGLSIEILDELSDVDRPEDLRHINHHPDAQ